MRFYIALRTTWLAKSNHVIGFTVSSKNNGDDDGDDSHKFQCLLAILAPQPSAFCVGGKEIHAFESTNYGTVYRH